MSENEFLELSLYLNRSRRNFRTSGGQMPCMFRRPAMATGISWRVKKLFRDIAKILMTILLKYSNDPNTRLVWYSNGLKVSDCQMIGISNGRHNPFEITTKLSGFWMVKLHSYLLLAILFEIQTKIHVRMLNVRYSGVRYLDGYCINSKLLIPPCWLFKKMA